MRIAFAALLLTAAAAPAAAETLVVTADRMVDVLTGRVVEEPLVVITDGRISSVGRQGDAAPAGAERVDLPGVTLTPGLIDMHVHLTSVAEIGGYNYLEYSDAFWPVVATKHARDTLEAGFTTVRNVGSENYADVGLREAIDGGYVPGPRIVSATYALGATGGHCDSTFFRRRWRRRAPTPSTARTRPGARCGWLRSTAPR